MATNRRKIILTKYTRQFWSVAKVVVYEDGKKPKEYTVNLFHEVKDDAILIYDTVGGSGIGFKKGELLHRIPIGDAEFETVTQEYADYE